MIEPFMQRIIRNHVAECARYCEASLVSAHAAHERGDFENESFWRDCAARWSAFVIALVGAPPSRPHASPSCSP